MRRGSVCLALTLTHNTGPIHVSPHDAVSAYLQGPRIGRTLPSSLGELTGRAGLGRQARALDSSTAGSRKE